MFSLDAKVFSSSLIPPLPFLERYWKYCCVGGWSVFILFQILIGIDKIYSTDPICPYSDTNYGSWYDRSYGGILASFAIVWCTMFGKLLYFKPTTVSPSYLMYFNIVSMSLIATILSSLFDWGGVCIDSLGVASPASMWGEWLACGPLLLMTACGVQEKDHLSKFEWILVILFFVCLASGFLINIPSSQSGGVCLLTLACVTYAPLLLLIFIRPNTSTTNIRPLKNKGRRDIQDKQQSVRDIFNFSMPLFAFVYMMAYSALINHAQTIIIFQGLSLAIKGVYAAVVMDLYEDALLLSEAALCEERRANDSRRAFLKYLFHEVRTPLNSLSIGIEILDNHCKSDIEANESLVMMRGACEFMSSTLNDVLSMQKIEEGKLELDMRPFAFSDALTTVSAAFKGAIVAKSLRISYSIASDLPAKVVGDRFRVEHVIANLVSNAIKFSPPGGSIAVTIAVDPLLHYQLQDAHMSSVVWVKVSVQDDGPGISEENQKKLFNSFMQIDAGDLQGGGGSGLGLSLCKEIVNLHGGTIGVSSKECRGSCFYFSIPFHKVPPCNTEEIKLAIDSTVDGSAELSNHIGDNIRALVVDDTESNRKMLKMLLKKSSILADVAENGMIATEMVSASHNDYDIIFMDNQMPVMNGLEAAKVLRTNGFKNLIIGVTGNVLEDDVTEFIAAGADIILGKPLRMHTLMKLVQFVQSNGSASFAAMTLVEEANQLVWKAK